MSIVKDKKFWFVLVIFILLLGTLTLLRMKSTGTLLGQESYYNLRLAETIQEKGLVNADELSYGSRPLVTEKGYPFLLSFAPEFLSTWLPLLLGLLSFILFYMIMKELDKELPWIASLLLLSSPSFLYYSTAVLKHSVAITLTLLGIYLYLKKEHIKALFVLAVLPFFSIGASIIVAILSWAAYRKRKINNVQFATLNFLYVLLIVLLYTFIFSIGLPELLQFSVKEFGINFFKEGLLAEFGGAFGIGSFLFLIGMFGIYAFWKAKYKYVLVYTLALALLALSFYTTFLLYYFSFVFAGLGSYALLWLWRREWKLSSFRTLILIVIICGLLFGPVSYLNRIDEIGPSRETMEAMQFFKGQQGEDVVLSDYSKGIMINYGRKQNIMDSNFLYAPQVNSRREDLETLFHTPDREKAREILNKYDVTYIYIDKEMEERIWDSGEKEFLFMLRYSNLLFGKLYENEEAEIYLVY